MGFIRFGRRSGLSESRLTAAYSTTGRFTKSDLLYVLVHCPLSTWTQSRYWSFSSLAHNTVEPRWVEKLANRVLHPQTFPCKGKMSSWVVQPLTSSLGNWHTRGGGSSKICDRQNGVVSFITIVIHKSINSHYFTAHGFGAPRGRPYKLLGPSEACSDVSSGVSHDADMSALPIPPIEVVK